MFERQTTKASLLEPKNFLLAAVWDLSYQGSAPCDPDWAAQRWRLRRISQWRTSKSTLRFYKLCCFVFCIQMSGILLLWFGGHDFLCYRVPKCSHVDYDAIEPRTLCLEDGSFNSPLLVQIHHAKRTETWQKDKYLNSAADWFVFAQNWKVMQLNVCRICLIPAPVFFASSCTSLSSGSFFEGALFREPLFQMFLLGSLILVFQFFLWRCLLLWFFLCVFSWASFIFAIVGFFIIVICFVLWRCFLCPQTVKHKKRSVTNTEEFCALVCTSGRTPICFKHSCPTLFFLCNIIYRSGGICSCVERVLYAYSVK